jgi:hypothetical protein
VAPDQVEAIGPGGIECEMKVQGMGVGSAVGGCR